ncbi:hypothetical protein HF086_001754 [Spodoptera exigua]|uniref:CCDC113/CCDC96 coiled-coil domain-containing protein n=1 Tax=Spodoptera exigua TaxID=7107 RepID=A0A922S8L4_SPOEX|nr:hypothetical protein HF086_001754 [Spodoptera exigua]
MTGTKGHKTKEETKPKPDQVTVAEAEGKTDANVKVPQADGEGSSGSSSTTTKSNESSENGIEGRDNSQQIGNLPLSAIHIDRDEYLAAHRELTLERQHQQVLNNILHRRLAEYYKKRKCEHVLKPLMGASDMEEKYQQKLISYQELKEKSERDIADIKRKVTEVEETYTGRLEHANKKFDELQHLERSTEREDELIKNRTKCTEHNQILAHIREKMHHTDEVIDFAECDLGDAEMEFYRAREDLGMVKSHRNKLRWSLEEEKLKAGLLTRKDLLRDFQSSLDMVVQLGHRKKQLEAQVLKASKQLRHARKNVLAQGTLHRQHEE